MGRHRNIIFRNLIHGDINCERVTIVSFLKCNPEGEQNYLGYFGPDFPKAVGEFVSSKQTNWTIAF